MSCVIYLVRHAIAGAAAAGMSDSDRALTSEGEWKMRHAAAGLKRLDVTPDVVLSSPLRRAADTAAVVVDVLAPKVAVETYPPLAPGHEAADVVKGLRPYRTATALVLVGHEPDVGRLASYLLTGSADLAQLPFKKGAVAAVGVDTLPPRAAGELLWFMTSKQLRAIGGRGG